MASLTVKQLEALSVADKGRKLPDGESMFGTVRVSKDAKVSVDFEWRYRFDSKTRQVRVGTWPKLSLGDIRRQRDAFKAQVQAKDRQTNLAVGLGQQHHPRIAAHAATIKPAFDHTLVAADRKLSHK